MKRWKVAVSLAVVAAFAAPFTFGTWKARPYSDQWISLTTQERANLAEAVANTDCQKPTSLEALVCDVEKHELEAGGEYRATASLSKYLTMNAAVVLAAFLSVLALAFILPVITRRYWQWLNA